MRILHVLGDSHVDDGTISFLMVQIMEETGSNLGHETRYSDGGVLFFSQSFWANSSIYTT